MRVCVIDGGSVWGRSYYSKKEDAAMAAEMAKSIVRERINGEYDRVIVAIDSETSWRKDEYPSYKSQRPEREIGYYTVMASVWKDLANECAVLGADGFEADDVVATVCAAIYQTCDITILSDDKDLYQCLQYAARVETLRGKSFTGKELGIKPSQVPMWLALAGDSSDNLPGVPGIGDKYAREYCNRFPTLSDMGKYFTDKRDTGGVSELSKKEKAFVDAIEGPDPTPEFVEYLAGCRIDAPIDVKGAMGSALPSESETLAPVAASEESVIDQEPASLPMAGVDVVSELVVPVSYERALEPTDVKTAITVSNILFRSQLFKLKSPEQAFTIVAAGRGYKLSAVQSLQDTHLIEGKMSMSAVLMRGLCLDSSVCEYFRPLNITNEGATVEAKRVGDPPFSYSFTMDQARAAGLAGRGNWKKYPDAMCLARATAFVARAIFADVVHGCYDPDELDRGENATK